MQGWPPYVWEVASSSCVGKGSWDGGTPTASCREAAEIVPVARVGPRRTLRQHRGSFPLECSQVSLVHLRAN